MHKLKKIFNSQTQKQKHKILSLNEFMPCIPFEHQKTLRCSTCMVAPGTLVNAGQELCSAFLKTKFCIPSVSFGYLENKQKERSGLTKSNKQVNNLKKLKLEVLATPESGQVLKIDGDKIILRRAHCYFISSKSELSIVNNEYIKKGNALFNLKYEKLLTGDIVQGLGKIEELLEYPKLSLNLNFKVCLRRYLTKVSLNKAIQWSYGELQSYLVKSIQQVYVDQGCFISDKHLEIIVRQATCLGVILFPGDTGFLHHEIVNIDAIEKLNKEIEDKVNNLKTLSKEIAKENKLSNEKPSLFFTSFTSSETSKKASKNKFSKAGNPKIIAKPSKAKRGVLSQIFVGQSKTEGKKDTDKNNVINKPQPAIYYPHLKGITWNSLNSDSILSAASFQETRRVLRDNLITDKVDFLKGIKERIILGELLEIGTGFYKNCFTD